MKAIKTVVIFMLLLSVCFTAACGKSENKNGQGEAESRVQEPQLNGYEYASSVVFYVNNLEVLNGAETDDSSASLIERVVRSYVAVMETDGFFGSVCDYINGLPGKESSAPSVYTVEKVKGSVSFEVKDSLLFTVKVTGTYPETAETIAKAIEICAPGYMDEITGVKGTLRVADKAKDAVKVAD